jgi:hypothetical protein
MLPVIRSIEKSMMSALTEAERRTLVELLHKLLLRSAELAAEPPVTAEGPRVRPDRSA